MKLWLWLGLCAVTATASKDFDSVQIHEVAEIDQINTNVEEPSIILNALTRKASTNANDRNLIVNALIRQMFAYIRFVIKNGSSLLDIPPMDPLKIDDFYISESGEFFDVDLRLKNVLMTGMGDFVVHASKVDFSNLSFDLDISVPKLHIRSDEYDLLGTILSAIPLYGKGGAEFIVEKFRFRALLFLKQSEDDKSVLIDRIERARFEIPSFTSNLDGVIGGGNIDAIVNAVIEDVIISYVNRFQGAISSLVGRLVITHGNPVLDQLDTWRFIRPFV